MRNIFYLILKAAFGWFAGWMGGYLQRRKLASETARADTAEQTVREQTTVIHNAQVREEVTNETAKLPDRPAVRVGDAPADSAAGKLRDEFSRD